MKSLLALVALLAAAPAHADRYADKPWSANAVLGFGAPTGGAGAELNRTFLDHIELGVGAGVNSSGPQAAGMARFRANWTTFALHAGIGGSFGAHDHEVNRGGLFFSDVETWEYDSATWMNMEVGLTWRNEGGAQFRLLWGHARLMNPGDCAGCAPTGPDLGTAPSWAQGTGVPYGGQAGEALREPPSDIETAYLGVSLGKAF